MAGRCRGMSEDAGEMSGRCRGMPGDVGGMKKGCRGDAGGCRRVEGGMCSHTSTRGSPLLEAALSHPRPHLDSAASHPGRMTARVIHRKTRVTHEFWGFLHFQPDIPSLCRRGNLMVRLLSLLHSTDLHCEQPLGITLRSRLILRSGFGTQAVC